MFGAYCLWDCVEMLFSVGWLKIVWIKSVNVMDSNLAVKINILIRSRKGILSKLPVQ